MTANGQNWLDAAAAEYLLDGTPSDAALAGTGSSADLAALLAAAVPVGKPAEELPGEEAAVAAFLAARGGAVREGAVRQRPVAVRDGRRGRMRVPRGLSVPAKAATATVIAAFALGGVAAAVGTGALQVPFVGPPGTRTVGPAVSISPIVSSPPVTGGAGTGTGTGASGLPAPDGASSAAGQDDGEPGDDEDLSLARLCRPYEALGDERSQAPDRLVEAAGGEQHVDAYCADRLHGKDGDGSADQEQGNSGGGTDPDDGDTGNGIAGTGPDPGSDEAEGAGGVEETQGAEGKDRPGSGGSDGSGSSDDEDAASGGSGGSSNSGGSQTDR